MKSSMYFVAVIALGSAIMQFLLLPIYIRLKRKKERYRHIRVVIKGCITLIAVLFCGAAMIKLIAEDSGVWIMETQNGFKTSILLFIGLFICMIADMVLSVKFMYGMALFLLGHAIYVAYFLTIAPFNPISIAIFIPAALIVYMIFRAKLQRMQGQRVPFIIYGSFILITFSTGIMLPFSLGPYGVLPAVSAVLLVISDYMLAINTIAKKKILSDLLYLGYYFTGQFFLALSVFVPVYFNI